MASWLIASQLEGPLNAARSCMPECQRIVHDVRFDVASYGTPGGARSASSDAQIVPKFLLLFLDAYTGAQAMICRGISSRITPETLAMISILKYARAVALIVPIATSPAEAEFLLRNTTAAGARAGMRARCPRAHPIRGWACTCVM